MNFNVVLFCIAVLTVKRGLLVDLFTEKWTFNRDSQGARAKRHLEIGLQPFTFIVALDGKKHIKSHTKAEPAAITLPYNQSPLYSGFYVNELLTRVIESKRQICAFQHYLKCLTGFGSELILNQRCVF